MSCSVDLFGRILAKALGFPLLCGLLFAVGCRSFEPQSTASPIFPSPAPEFSPGTAMSNQPPASLLGATSSSATSPSTSQIITPEQIQAFRPIVPPSMVDSAPVVIRQNPPPLSPSELPSNLSSVDRMNELNSRIAMLEKALAEKDEQLRLTQLSKPLPMPSGGLAHESFKPLPQPDTKSDVTSNTESSSAQSNSSMRHSAMHPFPALGIPGVMVTTDQQRSQVRIEITDSVLFTPNTWQLNPGAEESLRKIAAEIRAAYPEALLDIEGHADSIERDPSNKTQKHDITTYKSMLIMQYFVKSLLWDASKIKSSSHGASRPVADNGTPEGRNRNNRIEIVVSIP